MKKWLKYGLIFIGNILIFIIIWVLSVTVVKNVQKVVLVENFKKNCVYQEELSSDNIRYYKKESNETLETLVMLPNGDCIPGNELDVVVSTKATLINDFVSSAVTFFVGGHASIVCREYYDYYLDRYIMDNYNTIEATELYQGHNDVSVFDRFYWTYKEPFDEVSALRIKMTEKERDIITSYSASLIDDPYNTTFLFDTTNKSYCSDIVSKTFNKINKNLNKDGFVTTIYDLLVSSDCYISYYHYFDSNNVKHVYYLG